ncbi:MAG: alpha/beta hydrolase [Clostridia bacterium]
MEAWKIVLIVFSALILFLIILFFVIGEVCENISMRRNCFIGKIVVNDFCRANEKYKIDYKWWDNIKIETCEYKSFDGLKLKSKIIKLEDNVKNINPNILGYWDKKVLKKNKNDEKEVLLQETNEPTFSHSATVLQNLKKNVEGYKKNKVRVAVVIHGYMNIYKDMQRFAKMFLELGFNVVLPECRGHGESEGKFIGMGWPDRKDVQVAIKRAIKIFGEDCEIVVFGVSMGGATTCMLSGEDNLQNIKCFVSDCAYTSIYEQIKYVIDKQTPLPVFPTLQIFNVFQKIKTGYSLKDGDSRVQLEKCDKPILFIHGSADNFVPFHMLAELVVHAKNNEVLIVDGADHAESQPYATQLYTETLINFLKKYI